MSYVKDGFGGKLGCDDSYGSTILQGARLEYLAQEKGAFAPFANVK